MHAYPNIARDPELDTSWPFRNTTQRCLDLWAMCPAMDHPIRVASDEGERRSCGGGVLALPPTEAKRPFGTGAWSLTLARRSGRARLCRTLSRGHEPELHTHTRPATRSLRKRQYALARSLGLDAPAPNYSKALAKAALNSLMPPMPRSVAPVWVTMAAIHNSRHCKRYPHTRKLSRHRRLPELYNCSW